MMVRLLLMSVAFMLAGSALAQDETERPSPNIVIEETAVLLDAELADRREELAQDPAALYALIDSILLPRFDQEAAAQYVLRRHWRVATDEQKAAFIDAFYDSLMQRYADGLIDFDLSRIEILPFRGDVNEKRATVRTRISLDDGNLAAVNYAMIYRKSMWRMFDVAVEGVSFAVGYHGELDPEIKRDGLDAVIERLQRENAAGAMEAVDSVEDEEVAVEEAVVVEANG